MNVRGLCWILEKLCEVHGDPSPKDGSQLLPLLRGILQSRNCFIFLPMMRGLILNMLNYSSSVLQAHPRAAERWVLAMYVQAVVTGYPCFSLLSSKAFVV